MQQILDEIIQDEMEYSIKYILLQMSKSGIVKPYILHKPRKSTSKTLDFIMDKLLDKILFTFLVKNGWNVPSKISIVDGAMDKIIFDHLLEKL